MSIEDELRARSDSRCELCGASDGLAAYEVAPSDGSAERCVMACVTCRTQLDEQQGLDANHWRCLNDSMWSQVPAVQVVVFRMLSRLTGEGWPQDLLDMMYLEDDVRDWAEAGLAADNAPRHVDSNGAELAAGDTVTLIKDLDVKGSSLTAKRGTAVRNIRLVADNPEQIEGKVEGQQIVILTRFVKKSG
jgi:protein PhnA